jgi:Ca2+-binding EF-hand superfamily protein
MSQEDREFIASVFKEYDVDASGTLGVGQLAPLLTALNGGVPPTAEEIHVVLRKADNDKSGSVTVDELKDVFCVWHRMCKAKSRKVTTSCAVM